jgi:3-dehydroquinate dehydratase / shikimate dehydrogenase
VNNGNICVSVFAPTAKGMCEQIRRAEPLADIIELRFDYFDPGEIEKFVLSIPSIKKRYLFTFRPKLQGGPGDISRAEREAFWAMIHSTFLGLDYLIDYEADLDFPSDIDRGRLVASTHNFGSSPVDAASVFNELLKTKGGIIKIAQNAEQITDAIPVWSILELAKRSEKKAIPIAMGEAGKWTRILGLAHGAFLTYASLDPGSETAPGQISAHDLNHLYRVKDLGTETGVYGIIAGDTSYSMSPHLHNPAFKAGGVDAVFVPLQVTDIKSFLRRMVVRDTREVDLNFLGFSVTNPHKRAIMPYLSCIDPDAKAIGAVNTIKIVDGEMHGYNTDAEGFIRPLVARFDEIKGSRSAVIGTGGAARACVYMLKQYGSVVTVIGRDSQKSANLAGELGAKTTSFSGTDFGGFDIVVNATPIGTKGPNEEDTVATAEQLNGTKIVYDLTYNPTETRLAREAKKAGALFVGGLEMLISQGGRQFEIWTGQEAPLDVMRAAVRLRLGF